MPSTTATKTHYEVLELPQDTTPTDIKKAYRRLALQYHPDKNQDPSATDKFRAVSEAYEVLSDEGQRKEYDHILRGGGGGGGGGFGNGAGHHQYHHRPNNRRSYRDPFAHFNDVFQNDPFFRDAATGLDDLFRKTFEQAQDPRRSAGGGAGAGSRHQDRRGDRRNGQGWGEWMMDKIGIDVQMTTSTTDSRGQTKTSSYQRQRGGHSSSSRSTYTSKSTRTVIENGRRTTIQSLEKDGNKIEEKYVGQKLVGRTINGVPDDVGRIEF